MSTKNQELLVYIIKNSIDVSITKLMKLCYLVDLVNTQKNQKQISSFTYRRYNFGPFDEKIYKEIESLTKENIISGEIVYTPKGDEYITYIKNDDDFEFNKLKTDEIKIVDEVIDSLKGYGAKILTEITYKTKPMQALGATMGGNENLNSKLNLKIK